MTGTGPPTEHLYSMTVSLSVLDHLGLNLYSSMPAVLGEAVANSWDADAENVSITIDATSGAISIEDDGRGMSVDEINGKFLTVGYQRREVESVNTPKHGRHVMGRKGIGKLSLFAIANEVRVETAAVGSESDPHGLIMRARDIRAAASAGVAYYPESANEADSTVSRGTRIVVSDLKHRATVVTESALRTRLARRFSVIGPESNFKVHVNGEEVGIEDRDYFSKIEYLWSVGDVGSKYEDQCGSAKKTNQISGTVDDTGVLTAGASKDIGSPA